jgi:signal transduction histidine kinase
LLSLFSNLIVSEATVISGTKTVLTTGIAGSFFYFYALLLTVFTIFILIKKFKGLDIAFRSKIISFIIGIFLFALFNIVFNVIGFFLFPNNTKFTQFGDFSAIFFLGFTAYAIMKHQLFNIKVIATQSIVIVLSLVLLVKTFISPDFTQAVISGVIWAIATYGGWQLIKSVKKEIEQKEHIEKLAEQLEKANKHLKEVDHLKDDFLSMASHELNTPIAAIEGYLSMILDEKMAGEIPEKAEGYLKNVQSSSKRLARMVKELLNVSRIESNRIHLVFEQKPIEEVINQCIAEVMSKAREAKHVLAFEAPEKPMPLTWYDTTRITEVVINMLGNAIKYTPDSGRIIVRTSTDGDKIVVSVSDTGKGIPKDKIGRVFEKFSQVDVLHDQVKGTGLGMYISKKFVELHKGKIWFSSDGEGKGTTFYFSLPILKTKPFDPHEGEGLVLH